MSSLQQVKSRSHHPAGGPKGRKTSSQKQLKLNTKNPGRLRVTGIFWFRGHSGQIICKPGSVPGILANNPSLTIYLAVPLPARSSGSCGASSAGRLPKHTAWQTMHLLAADRVYLFSTSPCRTVSSYLTRFTLTRCTFEK